MRWPAAIRRAPCSWWRSTAINCSIPNSGRVSNAGWHVFPETTVAQYPDLLLARAWSARTGRSDTQTGLAQIEQVQALIDRMTGEPERARQFQGEIDALRCIAKTFAANDPQGVITLATRALETLPREWYLARATAWLHLAVPIKCAVSLNLPTRY